MNDLSALFGQSTTDTGIFSVLWNFSLCVGMGFILRAFYISRSSALTAKNHVGTILPILAAVVFLVITVVKSSLALSLGLVGALSIVRFRTPIKEPEELVYLFVAIGIGLGYGAGQTMVTTVIVILTLILAAVFLSNRKPGVAGEYNLILDWSNPAVGVDALVAAVEPFVMNVRLVRLERSADGNTAVFMLTPDGRTALDGLYARLEEVCGEVSVSFYESQNA